MCRRRILRKKEKKGHTKSQKTTKSKQTNNLDRNKQKCGEKAPVEVSAAKKNKPAEVVGEVAVPSFEVLLP